MKNLILFLFAFMLLGAQCRKNPPANSFYFRCYVNGKEYIPNSCANCITCTIYKDTIFLLGGNRGFEAIGLGIYEHPVKPGTYILNDSRNSADYDNNPLVNDIFKTDSIHQGVLSILTLDKTNRIISGTFHFKAYNAYRDDSVNVTNGLFRLKYNTN